MTFKFSARSLQRMEGLHPDVQKVIRRALQISKVDFTVIEGLRTAARQKELVAQGKSQTLNSRHLTGHAIDIAPFINGEISWDLKDYYAMAEAVKQAAIELKIPMVWGACWDKSLNDCKDMEEEVDSYANRRYRENKKPFIDGPHFELDKKVYP